MAATLYKIRTTDPNELKLEVDRIFSLIAERLDRLEGLRGRPLVYEKALFSDDVVVLSGLRGLVLVDRTDPPQYWRVTVTNTGTLEVTGLGASYG